jgi:acyl-CoA thioesterase
MNAADMQRLMNATEPFLAYMGFEVVAADDGAATVRLPLRREVTNHAGSAHGGAQYALGEATVIAVAATLSPPN